MRIVNKDLSDNEVLEIFYDTGIDDSVRKAPKKTSRGLLIVTDGVTAIVHRQFNSELEIGRELGMNSK